MSLHIHYVKFATDYTDQLRSRGRRKKARCFWEYFYDVQDEEKNSVGFYAKSWEVSKSTAHEWLANFKEEYELFTAAMELVNNQQNSSASKQSERLPNDNKTNKASESTSTPSVDESYRTLTERLPNKALNKYNNNNACDERLFSDLFNIYNMNTDFPGSKEKAFKQYEIMHHKVNHKELVKAVVFYLHDPKREGKLNNLENFLKNEVYDNYMPKHIRVFTSGVWLEGKYNRDTEVFTPNDGEAMRLLSDVLTSKFSKGELEFIREVAA